MMWASCTLQEAYNVPSFDTAPKKRKSCAAQAKASADPYDPYLPENGRGETASVVKEHFQSNSDPNYRGRASDYNYYSKEYNIPIPAITENFQSAAAPKCSASPQIYEIPISAEAKAQYDSAMKTALTQGETQTANEVAPKRKADMSNVSGYVDDDLEQYLQTKDMKAAPFITPQSPVERKTPAAEPYDPKSSPFAKAMDVFKGQMTPAPSASRPVPSLPQTPRPQPWSGVWDMVIFILAGILILFLCEQLFKLAMLIGMKRTVEMLEPYLKEA
jgi:hypothetical protein